MKKYLFLLVLLNVINCTTLIKKPINSEEMEKITFEINEKINLVKESTNVNRYEKIEEIFQPTFKNSVIINNIKQYDLSKLTFLFSDIEIISNNKAKNILIINYENESIYYDLVWNKSKKDGQWRIKNVAEKK